MVNDVYSGETIKKELISKGYGTLLKQSEVK
jgi:hypothetical protein